MGVAKACGAPREAWSEELGESYLALLRETGNARASARALGQHCLFDSRMRRNPAFRRACEGALVAADARLSRAESPFLGPVEIKSLPPGDGGPPDPRRGPKREPVIRRTSNGRTQISHVRDGGWTSAIEADFLARLRATGNFEKSARAVGFHPRTLYRRMEQWPAFARDCDEAIRAAEVRLDYKLIAHAHDLLRRPGETREEGEDEEAEDGIPFDPAAAMRILAFIDRRRGGRTTRGRARKGPPERTFQEAVASVLAKIAAIERHEKMKQEREKDKQRALPPPAGNGDEPPQ